MGTGIEIFPQLGTGKQGCAQTYFLEQGSRDENGINFHPVFIPILARGFISVPVPSRPH